MEEELSGLVAAVTSLRVQLEQPPLARCSDLLRQQAALLLHETSRVHELLSGGDEEEDFTKNDALPLDCWAHVFSLLPIADGISLTQTSKRFSKPARRMLCDALRSSSRGLFAWCTVSNMESQLSAVPGAQWPFL